MFHTWYLNLLPLECTDSKYDEKIIKNGRKIEIVFKTNTLDKRSRGTERTASCAEISLE